ncbi:MAG: ParB/RepB/Spo0J family partition protein, partial [Alphaproteobacteria bacterium]
AEAVVKTGTEGLKEVYTSQLVPGENQPRRVFNEEEIEALGDSCLQNGVLQPILVRRLSEQSYEIVAGERRWRAAKKIGLDRLPVLVRDMSDEEVMTVALVENLQRENLNALEEAQGYDRLLKKMGITQDEVAKLVGKSRSHVANMCRLLQLPVSVQNMLEVGNLSAGHAKILVGLEKAEDLASLMVQKKMSVRQGEKLLQKIKGKEANKGAVSLETKQSAEGEFLVPSLEVSEDEKVELRRIEAFLEERIGHKVNIGILGDASAQVIFSLASREDLDDFLAKLNTISA